MGSSDLEFQDRARELLGTVAKRVTTPRLRVLSVLLSKDRPLNHSALHAELPDMDRASLYRILDWLTEKGLAFRITDTEGTRRYGVDTANDHNHAHFHCTECGNTVCLPDVPNPAVALPEGFRSEATKVLISGSCPECSTSTETELHPSTIAIIAAIKGIPSGKVMSYGGVAKVAGLGNGARQVSRILHSSGSKHKLPWHRVLNAQGTISLSGESAQVQRHLLEKEGVAFQADGSVAPAHILHPSP